VCKRWAALLSEQRFWYRHVAALPTPLLPLLGVPPTAAGPLWRWYVEVTGRVRTYWDGPLMRPRAQPLWDALLWVAAGGGGVQLEAVTVPCVTYVRRPGRPTLTVSLAGRAFSAAEREVRRSWLYSRRYKKRKCFDEFPQATLIVHVWCSAERRTHTVTPAVLSERLLGVLLDGRACPTSCILE